MFFFCHFFISSKYHFHVDAERMIGTYINKATTTVHTAFYWHQIFALDSVFVNVQKLLISHGGFLTNAMYHHRDKI